ncbi:MAG TPA: SCO family protein [Solirubrobacter sp.]|nr:SCO family protein [Solirubrobacter sp.]
MVAPRLKLTLIALTVCAVAAVIGVTFAARSLPQNVSYANGWAGAQRPPHLKVPDFTLTDQDGKTVTSASLKGTPVVYAFIYSTCRDTCPAQVSTIRGALDDLGDQPHPQVIGVSVDPANDTPTRAKSFLLKQQMTGRMRFLLGTRQQLQPVWNAFGIQPQTDTLEHSAHTVLADARGMQRIGFPYEHLTQPGLVHDLERLNRTE